MPAFSKCANVREMIYDSLDPPCQEVTRGLAAQIFFQEINLNANCNYLDAH